MFPRGGGYSIYPWVGRPGPAPHTLTLFKTNITVFPTLFKTFKVVVARSVAFLLCYQWKFNVPGINANSPKSTEVNINHQDLVKILLFIVQEKISCLRQKLINQHPD